MSDTQATDLYQRWRAGDELAAGELFGLYATRLAALAQTQISQRLARRIDGDDVVQSVFRTFFRRGEQDQFQIHSGVELWRLLVKITVAKARTQARRHTSEKRDIAAECAALTADTPPDWILAAIDREPPHEQAVETVDLIEAVLNGLPETHAQVLAMRLSGHGSSEIAKELQLSRQTIYRVLAILQERITKSLADAG